MYIKAHKIMEKKYVITNVTRYQKISNKHNVLLILYIDIDFSFSVRRKYFLLYKITYKIFLEESYVYRYLSRHIIHVWKYYIAYSYIRKSNIRTKSPFSYPKLPINLKRFHPGFPGIHDPPNFMRIREIPKSPSRYMQFTY